MQANRVAVIGLVALVLSAASAIAGVTTRESVSSTGSLASFSTGPALSGNGRYLAFVTNGDFPPDDTNGKLDVYVRDLTTGTTTRVSVSSSGEQANGDSGA